MNFLLPKNDFERLRVDPCEPYQSHAQILVFKNLHEQNNSDNDQAKFLKARGADGMPPDFQRRREGRKINGRYIFMVDPRVTRLNVNRTHCKEIAEALETLGAGHHIRMVRTLKQYCDILLSHLGSSQTPPSRVDCSSRNLPSPSTYASQKKPSMICEIL